ncbi:MAG: ABC transporter ATP-binding protein [Candidatus Competibacterales bacterium]
MTPSASPDGRSPATTPGGGSAPLLAVEDLTVTIDGASVVNGLTLTLAAGETLALVGESGCGKSMTALALMDLLPAAARRVGGGVRLAGRQLEALEPAARRALRGGEMAMIFQEPGAALNPLMTVGNQIGEALAVHGRVRSRRERRQKSLALLDQVGMPEPALRLNQFPFELSGGQCQRVMIAIALAAEPKLLIADEPTTALDVTIQAQILTLLQGLQRHRGMGLLLITHDFGVVAEMADGVAVMYAGRIVEQGRMQTLLRQPRHPYTQLLLASMPQHSQAPRQPLAVIGGRVPSPSAWPLGCRFHPRCPLAETRCRQQAPPLAAHTENASHLSACWFSERVAALAPREEAGYP